MSKLSKAIVVVALAGVSLAVAGFAAATPASQHAAGTIAKIDAKAGLLEVKVGARTESFVLEPATALIDHGKSIPVAKLAPGERVEVTWVAKDGKNVSSRVEVLGSLAPTKPAATH